MTAQTSDFSGTLFYNPAGPGFSADIRATVTADTVSRPALTIYVEFYTGVPSEGPFSYMASSSDCNGTRCQVLSYEFGGVDGVITYANVLYDVNNAPRVVDDPFVLVTDPFGWAGLYGTVVLKVGTIGNTGDEGNYQKFDVVSWGIQSPVGLNQLATSSSTCSVTLNGDTKHYRIESDNSQVQIDSLPEHAHEPLSLTTGTLYWRVANLQNLTTNRFTNTSSEFFINRNRASFNVYVNADNTTAAGVQTYDVIVSKTLTGPALSTATGNVVNDTSQGPTYSIVPDTTTIDEGGTIGLQTVTYTITTTNVADGTRLYWTNSGTTNAADIGGSNSGYVDISGGSASLELTATADATTETSETIIIKLRTISVSGTIVATADTVTVGDTSQTPAPPPTPTYALAKAGNVSSVNEGTALTFNVTTTNVADGTTLYFYVGSTGAYVITTGRFSQGSGSSFTVTGNSGTFDITVSADSTTATDIQSYDVQLSTTFSPPTFVGSAVSVTVNDTSQTPPPPPPSPASFLFNGSNQYIEVQGSTTDWDMVNGTVEFWSKATAASTGPRAVMTQQPSVGIDIFYEGGYLKVPNTTGGYIQWAEPTPGVWTHVAIVSLAGDTYVFYNGVYQGHQTGLAWANTSSTIYIGRRQGNFQYFDGKLYGIRIVPTNEYVDPYNVVNFNPYTTVLPPSKISYTTLLLNPTDQVPLLDLSDSHHTLNASVGNAADHPAATGAHTLRVTTSQTGTSPGGGYITIANYPAVASVPVGATVKSDVFADANTSATLVLSRVWPFGAGGTLWQISYNPPAGTRATVPGDSFTFTW